MGKFDGILFCTDLDGTLYGDDGKVSKENLEAIEYFKSEGGLFTFITGRVPKTSKEVYDIIKPNAPFGCVNGGGIYDFKEERFIWNETLPYDVIELVREVDNKLPDVAIQYNTVNNIYFNKDNPALVRFRKITGVEKVFCDYENITEPVLKVLFGHMEDKRIRELEALLKSHPRADEFDFIRSEAAFYEILPKGVSKGAALLKMAELFCVKKTVAVGDYNNDVSMLKAADISFAVANATEEAKNAADNITVSNNNHAIAEIVRLLESE